MDKRVCKMEYKLSHLSMGVFQIRNTTNGKVFVDSSTNVPGKINRHKFSLSAGTHQAEKLQKDWNELGSEKFEFETLEPVEPREDANYNYAGDLAFSRTSGWKSSN